jgi:uncharacterized protein YndB with AHSA1/START domain
VTEIPRHAGGVRLQRRLDASPAEVWAALTEPESLSRWLGDAQRAEAVAGGAWEIRFGAGENARMSGRVRTVEHERLLEVEWSYPGEPPSLLRFELHEERGGVRLVVDHRGLDRRATTAYAQGWRRHLDELEGIVGS